MIHRRQCVHLPLQHTGLTNHSIRNTKGFVHEGTSSLDHGIAEELPGRKHVIVDYDVLEFIESGTQLPAISFIQTKSAVQVTRSVMTFGTWLGNLIFLGRSGSLGSSVNQKVSRILLTQLVVKQLILSSDFLEQFCHSFTNLFQTNLSQFHTFWSKTFSLL